MFHSALLTSCYVRTLLDATAEFPTLKTWGSTGGCCGAYSGSDGDGNGSANRRRQRQQPPSAPPTPLKSNKESTKLAPAGLGLSAFYRFLSENEQQKPSQLLPPCFLPQWQMEFPLEPLKAERT